MIYKKLAGTSLFWSINLPDIKCRSMRINCPVSVFVKKRTGEEMHFQLDSLTHLVDLLIREFEDGSNIFEIFPLTIKRAVHAIAVYYSLDEEFESSLEYEYHRFIKETALQAPYGKITPRGLRELYEQAMNLQMKINASETSKDDLEDALQAFDKHLEKDEFKS
jgi:hypothetical protein